MEIHNPGKFHLHIICCCHVIHVQNFSYQQKRGNLGCFWVFFCTLRPQIKSDLHKAFTSDAVQGKVSHILPVLIYYWKFQDQESKNLFFFFSDVFRPHPPTPFVTCPNLLSNESSHKDTQLCQLSSSQHLWFSSYKFSKVFVVMEHP